MATAPLLFDEGASHRTTKRLLAGISLFAVAAMCVAYVALAPVPESTELDAHAMYHQAEALIAQRESELLSLPAMNAFSLPAPVIPQKQEMASQPVPRAATPADHPSRAREEVKVFLTVPKHGALKLTRDGVARDDHVVKKVGLVEEAPQDERSEGEASYASGDAFSAGSEDAVSTSSEEADTASVTSDDAESTSVEDAESTADGDLSTFSPPGVKPAAHKKSMPGVFGTNKIPMPPLHLESLNPPA